VDINLVENKISSFRGKYRFLSNFYMCEVLYSDIIFPSAEHAYVSAKTTNPELRIKILKISSPADVKRFGKTMPVRKDWDCVKLNEMRLILESKFANSDLMHMLKSTYPAYLEEGNAWGDTFWGVYKGKGENNLGKLLMAIRDDISNRFCV
jgi:ribA/ribD-fused uncharacterized protein